MNEDEGDLTSPIGQIIKHINIICKKPQIDNQLGEALDLFSDHINDQQIYLSNGIFKTNFAEAALFLQSCAELYGKKVDLLWDELISCLTRLVQYDCEHYKEQGKEINQEVVNKLEERREKFKRKRRSKKAEEDAKRLAEQNNIQNSDTLCKEQSCEQSPNINTLDEVADNQGLEQKQHEIVEFTQIPGWNDIQCLFEQIDEKQLPDKNNLLSILKVCAYGRMRFLQQKKLPINEPFSTYNEEYLNFRHTFFENAVKKWQNVTLEMFEDLHKVLMYLSQKEKQKTSITKGVLETNTVHSHVENTVIQDINQKVIQYLEHSHEVETVNQIFEHSDDDSLFELSFICDENNTSDKSNLFVHLEQLSGDIINNKLRQDSGFYDFNSDDSCHSNDHENDIRLQENSIQHSKTKKEVVGCSEVPPALIETISEQTFHQNQILNFEENKENQHPLLEDTSNDTNDCDTSSVLSDHDYCGIVTNVKPLRERLGKRKNSRQEELLQNIINHKNCIACKAPKNHKTKCFKEKDNANLKDKQLMPPPTKKRRLTHKHIIKLLESVVPTVQENQFEKFFSENYQPGEGEGESSKSRLNEVGDEDLEGIRENDPQDENTDNGEEGEDYQEEAEKKQTDEDEDTEPNENASTNTEDTCRHSTDDPCSKNSQNFDEDLQPTDKLPSNNEEVICESSVSTSTEDSQMIANQLLPNDHQSDERVRRQSDMDDTLSVFSEHSYCQPRGNLRNDSGFVDMIEAEEEEPTDDNIETLFTRIDDIVADKDKPFAIEEEYQRLLHLVEESQKDMIDEQAGRPTEKQRKEQEALDLQRRVQEWENMIVPKLNELNGQDFDIHEYGKRIMDDISVNESKPFSQIVQGMTSAEVTRYFISSLQLANTNNIEVCGVKSGKTSNDTFEIKLLNRDRYHEHLNVYQAPSKETLRERLDKLRHGKNSENEYSKQHDDLVGKYPKKRRKVDMPVNINYMLHNSLVNVYINNVPSSSQERSNDAIENSFARDSNNNGNRKKINMDRNFSSKSANDNPQKGNSIKPKLLSMNHVSFEGCQAPQALSVQITSPRQLHTSLSNWNQPSTSHANSFAGERFSNEEATFDESALERDFQNLAEVQKLYPHNQMQSTPRNELSPTFSRSTVYSKTVGTKLFD